MDFFGKDLFNAGFSLAGPSLGQDIQKMTELMRRYCDAARRLEGISPQYVVDWYRQKCAEAAAALEEYVLRRASEFQESGVQQPPKSSSFAPPQDRTTAYYQSAAVPTSYYSQPSRSSLFPRGGYGSVAFSGGLSGPSMGQGPIDDYIAEMQQNIARCFAELKKYAEDIQTYSSKGDTANVKLYQDYYDKESRRCRNLQNRLVELLNIRSKASSSTVQARGSFVQPRGSMTAFRGPTPIPTSYYSQPSRPSYPTYGGYSSVAYSSPASRSSLSPFAPALRGSGFWQELTTTPLSL